jgi:hypothetical protein
MPTRADERGLGTVAHLKRTLLGSRVRLVGIEVLAGQAALL